MAGFTPGVGIGIKQRGIRVEISPGHSKMARLRRDLAEDLIGIAVQYSGVSGNIAFELPRIDAPFVNLNFPV